MKSNKPQVARYQIFVTIIAVFLLLTTSYYLPPILANGSPTPSPDATQQNLNNLQSEIASKAAALKSQVSQKIQNKAYIGVISTIDKTNNSIIVIAAKGNRQVSVDEYTTYEDDTVTKQSQSFGLSSLKENDTLACLGDVDDKNVLKAKKIVRLKALTPNTDIALWGKIKTVLPSSIDVIDKNNQQLSLALSGNTLIRFGNNEDATQTDIKPGSLLISIGSPLAKQISKSNFIYLFDTVSRSPSASPSAKVATPSASAKSK